MLCQHCNRNEASLHFELRNGYQKGEMHLCPVCAETLGRQYMAYMQSQAPYFGGWQMLGGQSPGVPFPGGFSGAMPPQQRVPEQVDEEFSLRRRLTELRTKLQRAVDEEDYEAAAKLRDEINTVKSERDPLHTNWKE